MRLFIKGQEIATRSENLVEDQYVTDDILNSVPIVLVTNNSVPEPEPEVEWSREISTGFFNAILKYKPNRNNLELTVLSYNEEEFAPDGCAIFDMHHSINIYKDTEHIGQMFINSNASRSSSLHSSEGYSNIEQLKFNGETPEFYDSISGARKAEYTGWINNNLVTTEEEFNNLIIEDYSVNVVRANDTAIDKQYSILNNTYTLKFINAEKIYYNEGAQEYETEPGTIIWMVKNEGIENVSILNTTYFIQDTIKGYQSSIIDVRHKVGNPCILTDNFLYFVDVNGDLNDSTTVFSVSTAYNLSDESCPFEIVVTQDPEWIDRGTIKIKDDRTFKLSDTCNGLYASIIRNFMNPLENSTLEASFISSTEHYEYGKEFESGEIICDHGYVQIWKDESLTYEECEEYANDVSIIYEAQTIADDFTLL